MAVDSLLANVETGVVKRYGRRVSLQPRQFQVLVWLMCHAGEVVTRNALARAVWQDDTATWTNVITVTVCLLRRELEQDGRPTILHTVRGRGYRLGERAAPDGSWNGAPAYSQRATSVR